MLKQIWARLSATKSIAPKEIPSQLDTVRLTDPNQILSEILLAHDLPCQEMQDWLAPNGTLPWIRAVWNPRPTSGRLDIHVMLDSENILEECFAGIGEGEQGLHDGMHNFIVNSLHVLLAGLWGKLDHHQVLVEEWRIDQKIYTAYIGNIGTRASKGLDAPTPPETFFAAIKSALCAEHLSRKTHWTRLFFCNLNGEYTFEALLDNQTWQSGLDVLHATAWEAKNGYYSARNFMLFREKF